MTPQQEELVSSEFQSRLIFAQHQTLVTLYNRILGHNLIASRQKRVIDMYKIGWILACYVLLLASGCTPTFPVEAQNALDREFGSGTYTIQSSNQASYPSNFQWGLGLVNRDYEEVWCVRYSRDNATNNGVILARKGNLWQVVFPAFVPPGTTNDVFRLVGCPV